MAYGECESGAALAAKERLRFPGISLVGLGKAGQASCACCRAIIFQSIEATAMQIDPLVRENIATGDEFPGEAQLTQLRRMTESPTVHKTRETDADTGYS